MNGNKEITVSTYVLETLKNNTDSNGQLKGLIKMQSEKIEALLKVIDETQIQTRSINETVKKIDLLLERSPIMKLLDKLSDLDKSFSDFFRDLLEKLKKLKSIETKTDTIIKTITDKETINLEEVRQKWTTKQKLISSISVLLTGVIIALISNWNKIFK